MTHHAEDSKYSVHHRKEIISILEGLRKERTTIWLAASNVGEITTYIIKTSDEGDYVYMDVTADEKLNSRIADSKHVTFTTRSGIKVKWHSNHIRLITLPDGAAFSILVPAAVQRIQRREHFRVLVPQGKNGLTCKISFLEETLEAPIRDMSAGGICIAVATPLNPVFSQGEELESCQIEFPVVGVIHFKLKIRKIRPSSDNLCFIGAEFMELSRGASNVIQRCLRQLEAEYRSAATAP